MPAQLRPLLAAAFVFLSAAVLAAASPESVQGSWKFVQEEDGMKLALVTRYLADGTYTDKGTITIGTGETKKVVPLLIMGTWKLDGEFLVITITDSSAPTAYPKGRVIVPNWSA